MPAEERQCGRIELRDEMPCGRSRDDPCGTVWKFRLRAAASKARGRHNERQRDGSGIRDCSAGHCRSPPRIPGSRRLPCLLRSTVMPRAARVRSPRAGWLGRTCGPKAGSAITAALIRGSCGECAGQVRVRADLVANRVERLSRGKEPGRHGGRDRPRSGPARYIRPGKRKKWSCGVGIRCGPASGQACARSAA